MIQQNSRPLAVLYGYRSSGNVINFIGRDDVVTLGGVGSRIQKILCCCNGLNTVRDIIKELSPMSPKEIRRLLTVCESEGIVKDSRELHQGFHADSSNPPIFSRDLGHDEIMAIVNSPRLRHRDGLVVKKMTPGASTLLKTIRARQSTRSFKPGQIKSRQLAGILEATYSIGKNGHWSVASGGGLYPLDLYLIVLNDQQVIPSGIYRWNPESGTLTAMSGKNPQVWTSKVFNAKTLLDGAACILCIAANLKRSVAKYGNRGYRLALLEAGHAAQNTYLFCAEQGIGVVECCGFDDKALESRLGLASPDEVVLTTLVLGKVGSEGCADVTSDQKTSETANRLFQSLVGEGKPIVGIETLKTEVEGYSMPLWAATATYSSGREGNSAFSTGFTSSEAVVKALAEGFERYALEQNNSEVNESAEKLGDPFLDPRNFVPLSPTQLKKLKEIQPFDPKKKIGWVSGMRVVGGEKVWVPTDLVYYAAAKASLRAGICYRASSSGVAAHFDAQVAVDSAIYELIERDALSVTWYSKRRVYSIAHSTLSVSLQSRISSWKKLGYSVSLLDLTLDGPPVVLAMIWSKKKLPALCSGASCRPNLVDAIDKAFNEAELQAVTWHDEKPKKGMRFVDIKSVHDHGLFYVNPQNLVRVEWLLNAPERSIVRKSFDGNLRMFDPVVVDITPKEHLCGLTVVRVLSDKLMPINFGYGNEHRGHKRMDALHLKWGERYPSTPHFFA